MSKSIWRVNIEKGGKSSGHEHTEWSTLCECE